MQRHELVLLVHSTAAKPMALYPRTVDSRATRKSSETFKFIKVPQKPMTGLHTFEQSIPLSCLHEPL